MDLREIKVIVWYHVTRVCHILHGWGYFISCWTRSWQRPVITNDKCDKIMDLREIKVIVWYHVTRVCHILHGWGYFISCWTRSWQRPVITNDKCDKIMDLREIKVIVWYHVTRVCHILHGWGYFISCWTCSWQRPVMSNDKCHKMIQSFMIFMTIYLGWFIVKGESYFLFKSVADPEGGSGGSLDTPPPPPLFFLNIPWKWNNLVSLRPNYFIFKGYLRKNEIKSAKRTPLPPFPLHIWTPCSEILNPPLQMYFYPWRIFVSTNSADCDEIPHSQTFHLIHCSLWVSIIKKVNPESYRHRIKRIGFFFNAFRLEWVIEN